MGEIELDLEWHHTRIAFYLQALEELRRVAGGADPQGRIEDLETRVSELRDRVSRLEHEDAPLSARSMAN
jgi:hypothetical protein